MKQRATTVFLGILTMISFCFGHASIQVNDFWTEPIISWIAVVLPTGKLLLELFSIHGHLVLWSLRMSVNSPPGQYAPGKTALINGLANG